MSELSIASIVANGKFDREFEFEALGNDIDAYSCDYSADGNPGLSMKFYQDGPTVTIYTSGFFNIRGAFSEEEMDKNRTLFKYKISKLGLEESVSEFQIANIVITSELKEHVNLNTFRLYTQTPLFNRAI